LWIGAVLVVGEAIVEEPPALTMIIEIVGTTIRKAMIDIVPKGTATTGLLSTAKTTGVHAAGSAAAAVSPAVMGGCLGC
jgi:hypothetical protein